MTGTVPIAPEYHRYVGALACAVVILWASLVHPGDGATSTALGLPVTTYLHLLAYAVFTVTLCYAMLADDRRALLLAALVATTYGGLVELLQGTLPYRTMESMDALLNAIGAGGGAVVWQRASGWFVRGD